MSRESVLMWRQVAMPSDASIVLSANYSMPCLLAGNEPTRAALKRAIVPPPPPPPPNTRSEMKIPAPQVEPEPVEDDEEDFDPDNQPYWCRWCGQGETLVNILVRSSVVNGESNIPPHVDDCICDECVKKCVEFVEKKQGRK
jgi:hypothetical protein